MNDIFSHNLLKCLVAKSHKTMCFDHNTSIPLQTEHNWHPSDAQWSRDQSWVLVYSRKCTWAKQQVDAKLLSHNAVISDIKSEL